MQLNLNLPVIESSTCINIIQVVSTVFQTLTQTKPYIPISGCVLEHILTTTNLTNCEKLYYILADSLALISKNRSNFRSYALPSEDWAASLGCSRSLVFTMQRSLVEKGYFIINKEWDEIGRNKRNLITPTLPISVFNNLNEKFPDRAGSHAPYNPLSECKRSYLDRTKLFIKFNYDLLKIVTSNENLNPKQKIIWLSFYKRCYKNYMLQGREGCDVSKYSYNNDSNFSFISSYRKLADLYSCNIKHLSKSIRALEELGFIKTQNIYIKKRFSDSDDYTIQERQDQSLWKITLSLPDDCILKLKKVKNRSNLKLNDSAAMLTDSTVNSRLVEDCLTLGGIKFNLNLEQSSLLKSIIVDYTGQGGSNDSANGGGVGLSGNVTAITPLTNFPSSAPYIDSVMEELDACDTQNIEGVEGKLEDSGLIEDTNILPDASKNLSALSFLETFDNSEEKSAGIKSDPTVAISGLLLNKDLLLKIKNIKSNLGTSSKVLFNDFLKKINKDDFNENDDNKKMEKEFNIVSELIRKNLKELPRGKADKARKFAYCLVSQKLTRGYAAGLSKHELAKQLIHHAATWKPTKLGSISREKEIDTALAVAWKAVVSGTWQPPLELAKAEILQHEFNAYKHKYQQSGVISHDLISLQCIVKTLLGRSYISLEREIKKYSLHNAGLNNNNLVLTEMQESYYNDSNSYTSNVNYLPQLHKDHSDNIELPSYLEEQECYLSYSYCDDKDKGIITKDYYEGLTSETEYSDTNTDITCKDEDKQNNATNQITNRIFDLSNISEKQKYLRMTTGENGNEMIIKTLNDTEYFYKLKSMEFNDEGDTIMTLKHVKLGSFIEEASNEIFAKTVKNNETCSLDDKSNHLTLNAFDIQNQRFL